MGARSQESLLHLFYLIGFEIILLNDFQNGVNQRLHVTAASMWFNRRAKDFERGSDSLQDLA